MSQTGIAIVTGWGQSLGCGHIQRMASLADFLLAETAYPVTLCTEEKPGFLSSVLQKIWSAEVPSGNQIIIRDLRDSSIDSITELKKRGPVCVIDDSGPGRNLADFRIDLLPGRLLKYEKKHYHPECFIYGINFINSLKGMKKKPRTIDTAVYTGFGPDKRYIDFLKMILPENTTSVFLSGTETFIIDTDKNERKTKGPYAELLLSSKILVTHFGITLYEGFLSRCGLATINPTEYHNELVTIIKNVMNIQNLGVYGSISIDESRYAIQKILSETEDIAVEPEDIAYHAQKKIKKFFRIIEQIIKSEQP